MITATISDFRKDVISLDEYNALKTTQHELSSKKNKERLDSAIEKFKKGDSFTKNLIVRNL